MNNLRIKPLTLALIASFAVAQTALADVASRLQEDVNVIPGRSISPADEDVISSSASRVLHHIDRARDALGRKDGEQAGKELKLADTLLDIIQATMPTTVVKTRVSTSDGKLKYDNTEEIPADVVPIYATLDERADFDAVRLPGVRSPAQAQAQAGKIKPEARPAKATESEARDAALYYEELDLPVNDIRHFVSTAQADLAKGRLGEADRDLSDAQASLNFVSVYLPDPLLAARINLERAETHNDAGQKAQAKADLSRAIGQLTEAEQQADPDSQADVKQMLADAQSMQARMDRNEPGLKTDLNGLWHRAKAHAERAMESARIGWAKLRHHDQLRSALIEAKRYVAYADIDANVEANNQRAMTDMAQARSWLDKAADATGKSGNGPDESVYLKDIRAVVDAILAGQARPDKGEIANLQQQLTQAIARS